MNFFSIKKVLCAIAIITAGFLPVYVLAQDAFGQQSQNTVDCNTDAENPACNGQSNTGQTGTQPTLGQPGNTQPTTGQPGTQPTTGQPGTQPTVGQSKFTSPTAGHINNLCDFINIVLNIVTELGALVAVLFIIWSGFLFVTAQGNKSKLDQAKRTFYTTIIGTAILLGSSIIAKVIVNTIGGVSSSISGQGAGGICSSSDFTQNSGSSSGSNF